VSPINTQSRHVESRVIENFLLANGNANSRQVLEQRRPTLTTLADSIDGTRVTDQPTTGNVPQFKPFKKIENTKPESDTPAGVYILNQISKYINVKTAH